MQIHILNRYKAAEWSFRNPNDLVGVISITDSLAPDNKFNILATDYKVLHLKFDDIDVQYRDLVLMSVEDANKIIRFVDAWINMVDYWIVHCEAGISRSAGVAGALLRIYVGDDRQVFNDYQYAPNRYVYRTIMNQYYNKGE